jgi:hypothetical protein
MKKTVFETVNKKHAGITSLRSNWPPVLGLSSYLSGHAELQPGLVSSALTGTTIFF